MKNKIPKSKPFHRRLYTVITPTEERSASPKGKCTNVTAVLNRPVVSPVSTNLEQRYSGYVNRHNRPVSAFSENSIRKVDKDTEMSRMNYISGGVSGDVLTSSMTMSSSTQINRVQEKEELQKLNDRFSAYIQRVRQLREQSGQIDSASFLKSAKLLEDEVANLKNMYETELHNLRCQLDGVVREKNTLQMQCNKSNTTAADLQDRFSVEADKNRKLTDEINICQRRILNLETELKEANMTSNKPYEDIQHLQRDLDNFIRENENLKRRLEKEQLIRQESDDKMNQMMKKVEFDAQIHNQEVTELRERLNTSTATMISMESRIRDLSKTDTSVPEMLKQVREAAEAELRQYKAESENQYSRNIASLKTQMECDAKSIERSNAEKTELLGSIGELRARITALEGQIQMLQHQKTSAEEMLTQERQRSADQWSLMETKFRQMQDLLVVKMQEANTSRDATIPLKAEIEAMKALLEEEERRINGNSSFTMKQSSSYTTTTAAHETTQPCQQLYTLSHIQPSAPPLPISSMSSPPPLMGSAAIMTAPPVTGMVDNFSVELDPVIQSTLDQVEYDEKIAAAGTSDYPVSSTKYTYEATPTVNKLRIGPSPPVTPRPVGPVVRVKSAPASGQGRINSAQLVPTSLGHGKDYFEAMFDDLKRVETLHTPKLPNRPKSSPVERYATSTTHDYTTSTSSAIGDIKIHEVNQDGKYIRLVNNSDQEAEFGGFMIQQNVGGHPVAVYRFPPRAKFPANSTLTVWSGTSDGLLHQPPSDYVWKEQKKWGTGPECTTILCKPNGQAIAWTTAAHRFTKNAFEDTTRSVSCDEEVLVTEEEAANMNGDGECMTEMTVNINQPRSEAVYLKREKQMAPTLNPQKHPHGVSPGREAHPHTAPPRAHTFGNDNSTVNRQARSQTTRPDPVAGQPYTGSAAQMMGSAPLRKYSPQTQNKRGNTTLSKQSRASFLNYLLASAPEH